MKKARYYIEKVMVYYDVADNRFGYKYESFPLWYKNIIWKDKSRENYRADWIKYKMFKNMMDFFSNYDKWSNDSDFPEFKDFYKWGNSKWENVFINIFSCRFHNDFLIETDGVWDIGIGRGPDYISKTAKSHLFSRHILEDIQKGIYIFGPEKDMYKDSIYSIVKLTFKKKGYDEEIIDTTKLWETV